MNNNTFIKLTKQLNLNLTDEMLEKLNIYADYLLEYNQHTNLTAIKTKEEIYLKHFYDSLTLTKLVPNFAGNLLDIGTGAGFPGVVLAICFPKLQVTLLDSNNKKITFLKKLIAKLNLNNIKIVYARAEEYTKNNKNTFDYITSRAVCELRVLEEISVSALKINKSLLVMKGHLEEEYEKSLTTQKALHLQLIKKIEFELPIINHQRTLLEYKKTATTSDKYPRAYDKIKKYPLK